LEVHLWDSELTWIVDERISVKNIEIATVPPYFASCTRQEALLPASQYADLSEQ
jgi:hypothetical protein